MIYNENLTEKCKPLEKNLIKLANMFDIPIYAYLKDDSTAEVSVFKIEPENLKKFMLGKMVEGKLRKGSLEIKGSLIEYKI